jgi:predicted DNA-binding transcriptional regulator AlpA
MQTKILRPRHVCETIGCSKSGLDRLRVQELIPEPIKLSPRETDRSIGWPADEIEQIVAARIAGFSEAQQRALVADLVGQRQRRAPRVAA